MSEARERRLFLVRHASAESAAEQPNDRERMLRPKGVRESVELGFEMKDRGYTPELVLGSDSARTWQTWQQMIGAFSRPVDARFTNFLYLCSDEDILKLLRRLPDTVNDVMIVGHNPSLETLAVRLSGDRVTLNPADMIGLRVQGGWVDFSDGAAQVLGMIRQ